MLLSHRYRLLFVHIPKTGGTSLRAALRRKLLGDPLFYPQFLCKRISGWTQHRLAVSLPRHAPAIVAQEMLAPDYFESLFRFSFVRNPWDRMVSIYCHCQREHPDWLAAQRVTSFSHFVHWLSNDQPYRGQRATLYRALRRTQSEYLCDLQGNRIVNYVGRFETLAEDYRTIMLRLGCSAPDLRHHRKSRRKDYRDYYDEETAQQVKTFYEIDRRSFQYTFDGHASTPESIDRREPSQQEIHSCSVPAPIPGPI